MCHSTVGPALAISLVLLLNGCDGADFFDASIADAASADAGPDEVFDPELGLLRVDPDHGPFGGGNLAVLRGSGFTTHGLEVRFGDRAVPGEDVVRIDPSRLQVRVPAGEPGAVDVAVRRMAEEVMVLGAYTYDLFAIAPTRGPMTGGTWLRVTSAAPIFGGAVAIRIAGEPCLDLAVLGPEEVTCRTPGGPRGPADVEVTVDGAATALVDAFEYDDPFDRLGGLAGDAVDGWLAVKVLGPGAEPVEGALVVVDSGEELRARTNARGIAVFREEVSGPYTVIAFDDCMHRGGFVGADREFVTIPLRLASLAPECVGESTGGPPPPLTTVTVEGTLRFFTDDELPAPTDAWERVPEPAAGEARVAYVWLSDADNEVQRIYERDRGAGPSRFEFDREADSWPSPPQVYVPIALAGLEGPSGFTPYVIGVGVPVSVTARDERLESVIELATGVAPGPRIALREPPGAPYPLLYRYDTDTGPSYQGPSEGPDSAEIEVRYDVPARGVGLGLFFAEAGRLEPPPPGSGGGAILDLQSERYPGAGPFAIPWIPAAAGPLSEAVMSVVATRWHAGPRGEGRRSERLAGEVPYTRVFARRAIGSEDWTIDEPLGLPQFTAPASLSADITDRTVAWTLPGDLPSFLEIELVARPTGSACEPRLFFLVGAPDATEVRVPDVSAEGLLDLCVGEPLTVVVRAREIDGVRFDSLSTAGLFTASYRRASQNVALGTWRAR